MSNLPIENYPDWDAIRRAEHVLRLHNIPNVRFSYNQGPRASAVIESIIHDVRAAKFNADFDA